MSIIDEIKEHKASEINAELVTLRAITEEIMLGNTRKALDICLKLIAIKEEGLKKTKEIANEDEA